MPERRTVAYYRQIIYLNKTEPPLREDDCATFRALCQEYGTEKQAAITVISPNDEKAVEDAENIFTKMGIFVEVIALSVKTASGWQGCFDERCVCVDTCRCPSFTN
jgi:hypothetical protein